MSNLNLQMGGILHNVTVYLIKSVSLQQLFIEFITCVCVYVSKKAL